MKNNREAVSIFIIDILKNIISVYFDTFFVFYFFKVANYQVLPLAKYYLTLYLFIGIGFIFIRNAMKKNNKVPYFRIGIALQALYISLIMLLKENIIHYVYLVGFVKGIADGFYHFPKNILSTEKITNESRQKFDGLVNTVNKVFSIIIPIILGVLLTYFSYTNLGKIFFILFIFMFFLSFQIKDNYYIDKKVDIKGFISLLKKDKSIRSSLFIPFLSGFTYSSGVMGTIITLFKINNFKTNLNLGFVDSLCAAVSLFICIWYATKMKKEHFGKIILVSGFCSCITLILFSIFPNGINLVIYLFIRFSFIKIIELISNVVISNLSNHQSLKKEYKTEYYLSRDIIFSISRCMGYLLLLFVVLVYGMEFIHYILILCSISVLLEAIIIRKLSARN